MRFSEASTASEVSFDDPDRGDSLTSEDKEIKLLEGELASIQVNLYKFRRCYRKQVSYLLINMFSGIVVCIQEGRVTFSRIK